MPASAPMNSMPKPPARLPVALGERGYDILVGEGLLARAGALIAPVLAAKRVVIVTDANVAPLHLPALRSLVAEHGRHALKGKAQFVPGLLHLAWSHDSSSAFRYCFHQRRASVASVSGVAVMVLP